MTNDIYDVSHEDMTWRSHPYRIYVATPRSSQAGQGTPAALYILDGNAQFPLAVNAAAARWTQLAEKGQATQAALPLIVGLGYPEEKAYPLQARTRDYTFAAPGEQFAEGGGAAAFYDFLHSKVKPYIQQHYQTDPGRQILAGHSFGGLFTLYVLLNHPDAFDDYIIGSPSLWWGNGAILSDSHGRESAGQQGMAITERTVNPGHPPVAAAENKKGRVTILQGEYEENPKADPNMKPERLARMQQRRSPIQARGLDQWLRERGINSQFILVDKSGHGGVIPSMIDTAIVRALNKNRE